MPTHQVQSIVDGQPTFAKPLNEILAEIKQGGALKTLTEAEYITDQQRKWYRGICLPQLVKRDENGESLAWWDEEVKRKCSGLMYLKKEVFFFEDSMGNRCGIGRLTIKGVGKKNMTNFIEEILSKSVQFGWCVSPPDKELRSQK